MLSSTPRCPITYMIGHNQKATTTPTFFKNAQFHTSVPKYMLAIKKILRNVRIRSIPACDYFYSLSEVWKEACRRRQKKIPFSQYTTNEISLRNFPEKPTPPDPRGEIRSTQACYYFSSLPEVWYRACRRHIKQRFLVHNLSRMKCRCVNSNNRR